MTVSKCRQEWTLNILDFQCTLNSRRLNHESSIETAVFIDKLLEINKHQKAL